MAKKKSAPPALNPFLVISGIFKLIVGLLKYLSRLATEMKLGFEKSWKEANDFRPEAEGLARRFGTTDPVQIKKQGQTGVIIKGIFLVLGRFFLAFIRAI